MILSLREGEDNEASFNTVLSKEDEWGKAPRKKASPPVDSMLIYMRHKFSFKWQKIARVLIHRSI